MSEDIKFEPGDRVTFKDWPYDDQEPLFGTVRTWESKKGFDHFWEDWRPRGWHVLSLGFWVEGWLGYLDDLRYAQHLDARDDLVSICWDNPVGTCDGYDPNKLIHVYDRV